MINTNASGIRAVKYGTTKDYVMGAQGGAGRRARPGDRLQGPQDLQRLQPDPALLRLGGHPGGDHRGHHEDPACPGLRHQRPPGVPGHPERRRRGDRHAHPPGCPSPPARFWTTCPSRCWPRPIDPEGEPRRGLHDHAGAGRPPGGGGGLRQAGGCHQWQTRPAERQVDRRPGGEGPPVGGPPPPGAGHEPPQTRLPPGAPDGGLRGAHDQDPRDHPPRSRPSGRSTASPSPPSGTSATATCTPPSSWT